MFFKFSLKEFFSNFSLFKFKFVFKLVLFSLILFGIKIFILLFGINLASSILLLISFLLVMDLFELSLVGISLLLIILLLLSLILFIFTFTFKFKSGLDFIGFSFSCGVEIFFFLLSYLNYYLLTVICASPLFIESELLEPIDDKRLLYKLFSASFNLLEKFILSIFFESMFTNSGCFFSFIYFFI